MLTAGASASRRAAAPALFSFFCLHAIVLDLGERHLLTLALSDAAPRYVERLVGLLSPKVVVPIHWDSFFSPLEDGVRRLPWIDVDAFAAEGRAVAPDATIVEPDYDHELVVPAGDPRGAGVA